MLSLHPANSSAFRRVMLESRVRKALALSKADEAQTPAPPTPAPMQRFPQGVCLGITLDLTLVRA